MQPTETPKQRERGACLSIGLAVAGGVFCLLVMILLTGGWFVYVLSITLSIFLFGVIHYFLWGRSMMRQTAAERERQQEEERRRSEDLPWPPPPPSPHIRRR